MKIYKSGVFIVTAILVTTLIFCCAALCNFCAIPALNTSTEEATQESSKVQEESTVAEAESKESISEESKETATETEAEDTAAQASESEAEEELLEEVPDEAEESIEESAVESDPAIESAPESEPAGEVGPSESVVSIGIDSRMSGIILQGEIFSGTAMAIRIGDYDDKKQFKGYLSFNIDALHGETVTAAEINIYELRRYNNPGFATYLDVKAFNYGTLDGSDFAVGGTSLARIPTSSASYRITGETLKNEVQKILDSGNDYFQLKLGLSSATDNDTVSDCFFIEYSDAELVISYVD